MAANAIVNIIGTQCQPQDVEKFNKWYDEVHVPMLLKFKRLQGVARYRVAGETSKPQFIAVYKFASREDIEAFEASLEFAAAVKEMLERWGGTPVISRMRCELINEWGNTSQPI
jgi:heme-degrading monooxygenase HmoA